MLFLPADPVIVDAGAHIGDDTRVISRLCLQQRFMRSNRFRHCFSGFSPILRVSETFIVIRLHWQGKQGRPLSMSVAGEGMLPARCWLLKKLLQLIPTSLFRKRSLCQQ